MGIRARSEHEVQILIANLLSLAIASRKQQFSIGVRNVLKSGAAETLVEKIGIKNLKSTSSNFTGRMGIRETRQVPSSMSQTTEQISLFLNDVWTSIRAEWCRTMRRVHKRNNEYGDEPLSPPAASQSSGGYGEQSAQEVPAPAEEAPSAVEQPVPAEAPAEVESSGYRKKRNNEYGDEPVPPAEAQASAGGYGEQSAPEVPAPAEEAPSAVEQPVPAEAPAEVESSGYRKKRNNEYGDEPVAPQQAPAGGYGEQSAPEVPAPAEEAPSAVEQPVPAEGPTAEVEASGY
ncbi:unnamed protein product [Toxocara canis]|uniref:Translation initiation factor IF-2 n=1 Tax=Toxocara canis TaxID=6265 RepID=A0A183TVS6_TOXCA|nr:unnamed protein product [Toxocara canis]